MTTNFKVMRIKAGVKQSEAARRLNIAPQTLANYESGRTDPPWSTVVELADMYDCNISDFRMEKGAE